MKINNPVKYNHIMLGGWLDKSEGVIFTNWELGDFVNCGTIVFGQDYGFASDESTLVKCSIDSDKKIIYVHECLYQSGLTTSQIYEINQKYAENHLIIADSAEPRLIAELRQKGLNIKGISKPLIIDRIALLQDYKIIVTSESTNIIKELNNYVWHERKSQTPVDMYNHFCDPIGYVLWEMAKRPTYKMRVR